jgi:hypothetical protein
MMPRLRSMTAPPLPFRTQLNRPQELAGRRSACLRGRAPGVDIGSGGGAANGDGSAGLTASSNP